jgi:hypothetical protein
MFKVVEMPTGTVLAKVELHEEAVAYIFSIESSTDYPDLLLKYGELRRVQQELIIEAS